MTQIFEDLHHSHHSETTKGKIWHDHGITRRSEHLDERYDERCPQDKYSEPCMMSIYKERDPLPGCQNHYKYYGIQFFNDHSNVVVYNDDPVKHKPAQQVTIMTNDRPYFEYNGRKYRSTIRTLDGESKRFMHMNEYDSYILPANKQLQQSLEETIKNNRRNRRKRYGRLPRSKRADLDTNSMKNNRRDKYCRRHYL